MKNADLMIRFSKTSESVEVDYYLKKIIRTAINQTLLLEGFDNPVEVSVTLCDNAYIKKLNAQFRNKDKETDVLSFPMYTEMDLNLFRVGEEVLLGDIVISLERAKAQAVEVGNPYLREVAFLAIHSTLHLLGYDHELSPEDDELQCARQREIIESFEI